MDSDAAGRVNHFVLLVTNFFQPVGCVAVELFLNGDMTHRGGRRCAVPVLLAWSERDHITWTDLFDGATPALCPSATGRDEEILAERMRMPRSTRTRLKGNECASSARGVGRVEERIN